MDTDLDRYRRQTRITDPGRFASRLDEVQPDLAAIRTAASRLVFHYRAGGDWAANGIPRDRAAEIHTRYAEPIWQILTDRSDAPIDAERSSADRFLGCCRDHTVLFLSMARHHGLPARARVGFASYFIADWFIDHEVAEVWDGERWRLVEPELRPGHVDPTDETPIDPLDVPRDRFLTGPEAWRRARSGSADPERFVVDPGIETPVTRGWPYLAHNLIHDLAALAGREMLLWDGWGVQEKPPTPEGLAGLDELAADLAEPTDATIDGWYARDGLRVTDRVTRYDPYGGPPQTVSVTVD